MAVIACAVFFVGITAFSFLSYYRAAGSFDRVWREDLHARVALLTGQLAIMDATAKTGADRLSGVFSGMLPGPIRVDESRPVQIGDRSVPSVYAGGQVLNLDFGMVDTFSRLTNGAATVFVRTGDDFMRVTSSIRNEDGSRAMGTMLGKGHPAYEPVMKGQPYLGRADLFGHVYMSRYSPVVDARWVTVAILYVGFDNTDTLAQLVKQIEEARIGQGGLFFVVDDSQGESRDKLIGHRDSNGRNVLQDVAGLAGYRAALGAGEGAVVAGDRMYVVTRFAPWKRVVGASISVDELHAEAVGLRNVLLLLGVAVLVVGCVATLHGPSPHTESAGKARCRCRAARQRRPHGARAGDQSRRSGRTCHGLQRHGGSDRRDHRSTEAGDRQRQGGCPRGAGRVGASAPRIPGTERCRVARGRSPGGSHREPRLRRRECARFAGALEAHRRSFRPMRSGRGTGGRGDHGHRHSGA